MENRGVLVGVQTNQYPRAVDLARAFRAAGVDVIIGGFHVSGTIALFHNPTPDIQEILDLGVTCRHGRGGGRVGTPAA